MQKKIKEVEKLYNDLTSNLDNKDNEMLNLKAELNDKEKNLVRIK